MNVYNSTIPLLHVKNKVEKEKKKERKRKKGEEKDPKMKNESL